MNRKNSPQDQIKPAEGEPYGLAGALQQACEQIGLTILSDDFCAKLLAYVYVMGGEVCVLHEGLNAGIQIAQQRARIYGGHIPDMMMVELIKKYIKELEATYEKTPWIKEIFDYYQIPLEPKKPKGMK